MKLLIIGAGGREHALAWHLAQDSQISDIFIAPGNAGTDSEPKCQNIDVKATDVEALLAFAHENHIDFTLIGPEAPLALGVVDCFEAAGLACFGPEKAAAQLEASKAFSKDFMQAHNIPTADYAVFTALEDAEAALPEKEYPLVLKADGLAAGKGVLIVQNQADARAALKSLMTTQRFGAAGATIVMESFLEGIEASFIAICDGKTAIPLVSARDHKQRDDGNQGPNTGGMGVYSPSPLITQALSDRVMAEVIQPTLDGMAAAGTPYRGFLYAGLMIDDTGDFKVLEFNCRLGDPETQVILPRLKTPLLPLLQAAREGQLDTVPPLTWSSHVTVGVVLASKGYPDAYAKHVPFALPALNPANGHVFHAGTGKQDGTLLTQGGRVVCITAWDKDIAGARQKAYDFVQSMETSPFHYRTDIAQT